MCKPKKIITLLIVNIGLVISANYLCMRVLDICLHLPLTVKLLIFKQDSLLLPLTIKMKLQPSKYCIDYVLVSSSSFLGSLSSLLEFAYKLILRDTSLFLGTSYFPVCIWFPQIFFKTAIQRFYDIIKLP